MDTKDWVIIELAPGLKIITRPAPGMSEEDLRTSIESRWAGTAFVRWARGRKGWPSIKTAEYAVMHRSGFVWWSGRPVGYDNS